MDLPILEIAEWATLLVDIRSPRGGSQLSIPIYFSGLAALISADIARDLRSLVCSIVNSYCTLFIFPLLVFFKICCFPHWAQSVNPIFFYHIL